MTSSTQGSPASPAHPGVPNEPTPVSAQFPPAQGSTGSPAIAEPTVPLERLQLNPHNPGIVIPGLDGYSGVELVAHGSSAVVYRAQQDRLKRQVAIKLLLIDDMMTTMENVEFELETLVRLSQQPHIVSIIDTGFTDAGQPFIVMEYAEGGSYAQILKESGPLSVEEVLDVGIKIGEALHAAHEVGIVHRDVKPPNILRTRFGPALTDFGIAYAEELSATTTFMKLTPHHASPETLLQQHQTGKSDLYSLASTMWNLLAGAPPFDSPGQNPEEFRRRVLTQPVPRIPREDVPAWLQAELARAMAKRPAHRHLSALEFAETLRLRMTQPAGANWAPPAEDHGLYVPISASGADPAQYQQPPAEYGQPTGDPAQYQPTSPPAFRGYSGPPAYGASSAPPAAMPPTPMSGPPQHPANIAGVPFSAPPHVSGAAPQSAPPNQLSWAHAVNPDLSRQEAERELYRQQQQPPLVPQLAPRRDDDDDEGFSWKRPLVGAAIVGVILGLVATIGILLVNNGDKSDDDGQGPKPTTTSKPVGTFKPTNVNLEDNGTSVTLSWKDTSNGKVPFAIFGAADGEPTDIVKSVDAKQTSTTVTGLDPAKNYCYKVAALVRDDQGAINHAMSDPVCTRR